MEGDGRAGAEEPEGERGQSGRDSPAEGSPGLAPALMRLLAALPGSLRGSPCWPVAGAHTSAESAARTSPECGAGGRGGSEGSRGALTRSAGERGLRGEPRRPHPQWWGEGAQRGAEAPPPAVMSRWRTLGTADHLHSFSSLKPTEICIQVTASGPCILGILYMTLP